MAVTCIYHLRDGAEIERPVVTEAALPQIDDVDGSGKGSARGVALDGRDDDLAYTGRRRAGPGRRTRGRGCGAMTLSAAVASVT